MVISLRSRLSPPLIPELSIAIKLSLKSLLIRDFGRRGTDRDHNTLRGTIEGLLTTSSSPTELMIKNRIAISLDFAKGSKPTFTLDPFTNLLKLQKISADECSL
ncbi:uncharacterized protein PGTG_22526 [Puccinia graminis f. sp. tritici CRL 75-36-700-3]|uniref:Uncharacterized protein n=1 Tax=Puccinia graminis f. sp. tritici (strain CRL 75-36-700-3 / race SCCL) TaxID=418459 RepID=H6QUX5_PUCGT|nr:uncharacterized protein PGTG_22526 [Puccinia graminis f. sp. tritici CRL 75-36-700-3]EHS62588.1 hypothetical protein PGTG_22526 [Puccinia graminis f. sp. tritici CRL 75-36-700-3]